MPLILIPTPLPGTPEWDPIYGGGSGSENVSVSVFKEAHDYLRMLLSLLCDGFLWYKNLTLDDSEIPQPGTLLQAFLLTFCHEMERFDLRTDDLMNEKDPATTYELITDWERVCGIPDECSTLGETIDQRREIVSLKLSARGGASKTYFLELAESLGWPDVTITEYTPCMLGLAHCNSQLVTSSPNVPSGTEPGTGFLFVWAVENFGQKITWLRSGSGASGGYLSIEETEDNRLKCYFRKLKPAHTRVIFPPEVE